jgi:hypothetical protein
MALRRTYGYFPFVLTTCPPRRELAEGIVGCMVNSWLTGRRVVSLPFSDHCEPLVNDTETFDKLLSELRLKAAVNGDKYIEIRPRSLFLGNKNGLESSDCFWMHHLDLRPTAAELFAGLDNDCFRRKIRRAEREGLHCEQGRSPTLLRKFYDLQVITRRRHQLVPQPFAWFQNLVECMGDKSKIRVVSKHGKPVASMLTLRFRQSLVYKYGCSDKQFSFLGGMQLLFWKAIQEGKEEGLSEFDLGRSEWDNEGLIKFKDRLGATRTSVRYWRLSMTAAARKLPWKMRVARHAFSHLPDAWLIATGRLLYRHIG